MDSQVLTFLLDNLPGNMSNNHIFNSRHRPYIVLLKDYLLVSLSQKFYDRIQKKYRFVALHGIEIIDSNDEEIRVESTRRDFPLSALCKVEDDQVALTFLRSNPATLISYQERVVEKAEGFTHEVTFVHNSSFDKGKKQKHHLFAEYDSKGMLLRGGDGPRLNDSITTKEEKTIKGKPVVPFVMSEAFELVDLEFYLLSVFETYYHHPPFEINKPFLDVLQKNINGLVNNPRAKIILSTTLIRKLIAAVNREPLDGFGELLVEDNGDFTRVGIFLKDQSVISFPKKVSPEEAKELYLSDERNQNIETLKELFEGYSLN